MNEILQKKTLSDEIESEAMFYGNFFGEIESHDLMED